MNDVKRVLIVEDLPSDAELVEREVRRVLPECEFLRVETRKGFLAALETYRPDIILSDYRLPQFDGMVALKLAIEYVPDIPFIITTGSMNEDTAVECMKTGAWDYIIKEHLKRLGPAVLSCLEQKRQRMERQTAEEALRESEEHYRVLFDTTPIGIVTALPQGQITGVNPAALLILGSPSAEATKSINLLTFPPLIKAGLVADFKNSVEQCQPVSAERPYITKWGKAIDLHYLISPIPDSAGKTASVQVIIQDISERKQAETYRAMGREVLQILNEPGNIQDSIQHVLTTIKTRTEFDAVGIRLQDGDDFPYFAQIGFSKDFLLTENTLIEHAADGGVCRDKDGNVSLECTCGMVLSNKADPVNPLLTPGGSFWTNDALPLLDIPLEEDLRHNPHNQCIHQGYATVALVPIRSKDRIVGLIQLNDRSKGRLILEIVELLEGIASHIGAALMRKQAEEQTKSSEERLKILFDYAPDAYYLSDLAGNFIDGNFAAEKLLGYAKNEMIGKNFLKLKLISAKQLPHAVKLLAKSVLGLPTGPDEFKLCRKDGSNVTVEISTHPVKIKDSTLVLGLARDITERRQAEEALRESETRNRTLIENVGEGIGMVNLKEQFAFANPASENIFGVPPGGLLGHSLREFMTPQQFETILEQTRNRQSGVKSVYEIEITRPDGKKRNVLISAVPQLDSQGQFEGTFGVFRDITERKQAEEALRESEEKMRMIVEGTPFFFFYTQDAVGDMVYISPTVEKITGRTAVEWMGQKHWFATDNPINLKAPKITHLHLLGENYSEPICFELAHKNGSAIMLEIFESPIIRDGKVIGLQGVAHDITARKKYEEKIKDNLDELQRWQDVMLDREDRVQELKREVNELCRRLVEPVRYLSQEDGAADSGELKL